jgi:hypothetical protein
VSGAAHNTVFANGFILEPFATNRTKITVIRCEDNALQCFELPVFA